MSPAVDTRDGLPGTEQEQHAPRGTAWWSWAATLALAVTGVLHLLVAAVHVDHSTLSVGFFLAVAAGQIGAAGLLFVLSRPGQRISPGILGAGIAATVAMIGLYLVSARTGLFADLLGQGSGASAGHHAGGHPVEIGNSSVALDQPVVLPVSPGVLDAAVLALEVLTVVALTALLPRTWRGRVVNALCALGALTWLLWLTGVLG